MKTTVIVIAGILASTLAASAQTYDPGTCLGNRCGYFGRDGGYAPAPNGGYYYAPTPRTNPVPTTDQWLEQTQRRMQREYHLQ
jgi:hypothetical protein